MPVRTSRIILATAAARSGNAKIGDAAATYAAQVSCPTSCAFFNGGGCYAENGTIYSSVTKRLNDDAAATGATAADVAHAEADAIDELQVEPGRPLRLHTVGDCKTDEAARIVAAACARYMERGGGPCWAYTHAWRLVNRESWRPVSVLASCETPEQVELARVRGYAPAIVVGEFEGSRRYSTVNGVEVLPCPQQTRGVPCSECRLCMNADGVLDRGYAIGFEIHGTAFTVRQARAALAAPSSGRRRLTLRQLIPAYLAEHPAATDREIARELGYAVGSVREMRLKLEHEQQEAAA
jgi:hypothetical protein